MKASLTPYRRKRDFDKTSEPSGAKAEASKGQSFVIQKHDATRLHFDLRLEMDGVLKSWAVPKGMPLAVGEKHLAVEVEDHPLDYASFEGTIPKGNYGGGTVMVWDCGHYELLGGTPMSAWKAGKLHFVLCGRKLNGEWTLVRTRRDGDKNQWLILKTGDPLPLLPEKTAEKSVLSARSMEEIATGKSAVWISGTKEERAREKAKAKTKPAKAAPKAKSKKSVPLKYISPMKPVLVNEPPTDSNEWIYEIKFDGYRVIAIKQGKQVQLLSANNLPLPFTSIEEAVAGLRCENAILDGEVVALDSEGRASFQLLQNSRSGLTDTPLCYYIFDLLHYEGSDLRETSTMGRKAVLSALLAKTESDQRIRFSANLGGSPTQIMDAARQMGIEGIVAKRQDAKYHAGTRNSDWLKVKILHEQEFVIGGYTPPGGSRHYFGSLIVGYYEKGQLKYAAKAGSGFTAAALAKFYKEFQPIKRKECPFVNLPETQPGRWGQGLTASKMKTCTWLDPVKVCQVRFTEWTEDGGLRHPTFLGMREDKDAQDVRRETALPLKKAASADEEISAATSKPAQKGRRVYRPASKRPR